MTIRTYSSPDAFKQALEQRLRTSAKSGAEFARKRQLLVFDRFLARVVAVLGDAATLKGGLVLELRLDRARTTKDVDLRMVGSPDDILSKLQEAARRDLVDFMAFEVVPDVETHLAEKLHAYTMPRSRPNSRVKDLPDLALLATAQPLDAKILREALELTFTFRETHALPARVPEPLAAWKTPYAAMARDDQLAWLTLDEVTKAAQSFLDPVLAGGLDAMWEPEAWSWRLH
jgi:hypothetical protein